jgi:hypothetical protein
VATGRSSWALGFASNLLRLEAPPGVAPRTNPIRGSSLPAAPRRCGHYSARNPASGGRVYSADSDEESGTAGVEPEIPMLFCRVVIQILPEPALDFAHAHSLAFAVVGDLIAVNLAEAEISRFGVGEVESAHA